MANEKEEKFASNDNTEWMHTDGQTADCTQTDNRLTGIFIDDTFTGRVISVGWIEMPLEMTDGPMSRV